MGPAGTDISSIAADGDRDVVIQLNNRSAFIPEALEISIQDANRPDIGTGPFQITSSSANGLEMAANPHYYLGPPQIDRIVFKPYPNLRAAWADMLRGRVDVLYDVDPEALDLLRPASTLHVFEFPQRYAYIVVFNLRRPLWKDRRIRQALNAAIDRDKLIANTLQGHGIPAAGPVWPEHWAYDRGGPTFAYNRALAADVFKRRQSDDGTPRSGPVGHTHFTCLFPDDVPERLALGVATTASGVWRRHEPWKWRRFRSSTGDSRPGISMRSFSPR